MASMHVFTSFMMLIEYFNWGTPAFLLASFINRQSQVTSGVDFWWNGTCQGGKERCIALKIKEQ